MLNDQEFIAAVLPGGFHISNSPLNTVQDIKNAGWLTGSIPIPADKPWYYDLADEPQITDEFTAWLTTAYVRANVSPLNTDETLAHKVLSFLVQDLIQYQGFDDEVADTIFALTAVVVGGAAHIRKHGYAPVDAETFASGWWYGRESSWD